MAPPIIKMSSYEETKNVMVYSDSGVGKTVFTGSGCGLILGVEQGLVSAKRAGSTADLWMIESWEGSAQDSNRQNNLRAAYKWLSEGGYRNYSWVGVDGITEMQAMAKVHLIKEGFEMDPTASEWVLEWQGNLELQARTTMMVKNFCKLPVNTVFTALPMTITDKSGEEKLMPLIEGKKGEISQTCCAQMGAVGHMRIVYKKIDGKSKEIRRIDWKYRKTDEMAFFGKNRFGLPAYTDDLSLPQVAALMKSQPDRPRRTGATKAPARRTRVARTTK